MKSKKLIHILVVMYMLISVVGCSTKAQYGAAGGAAGGALIGQAIGGNTGATLIGAAIGSFLGYAVGNEMDKYDLSQLNNVYERGVSGVTEEWVNPDTQNRYKVTPAKAYENPRHITSTQSKRKITDPCREAKIEAWIDGVLEETYTTACRDNRGRWVLQ